MFTGIIETRTFTFLIGWDDEALINDAVTVIINAITVGIITEREAFDAGVGYGAIDTNGLASGQASAHATFGSDG